MVRPTDAPAVHVSDASTSGKATKSGFFIDPKSMSNSSPDVQSWEEFKRVYSEFSARHSELIQRLSVLIATVINDAIHISTIIIGGSFTRSKSPSDMDVLLIYNLKSNHSVDVNNEIATAVDACAVAKADRIDAFLCPSDVHPALFVKRVVYFHNLFAMDRVSDRPINQCIMITSKEGWA